MFFLHLIRMHLSLSLCLSSFPWCCPSLAFNAAVFSWNRFQTCHIFHDCHPSFATKLSISLEHNILIWFVSSVLILSTFPVLTCLPSQTSSARLFQVFLFACRIVQGHLAVQRVLKSQWQRCIQFYVLVSKQSHRKGMLVSLLSARVYGSTTQHVLLHEMTIRLKDSSKLH